MPGTVIALIQNKYDLQYLPPLLTIQFVWQETVATCSSSSLSSNLVISRGHTKHEKHSLVPGSSVQSYCSNMAVQNSVLCGWGLAPCVDISRHSEVMKTKLLYLFLGDYTLIKTARCHYKHNVHRYITENLPI